MVFDSIGSSQWVVVLPYANYNPPRVKQHRVHFRIATHIAIDFRDPILDVADRLAVMERTSMPEATVYEHRHPGPREHHIGGPTNARDWARRYAVAQAAPVQY